MDIIGALKQEESKVRRQLTAVQDAMAALNGSCLGSAGNGEVTLSVNEDSAPSGRGFSRHERLSSDAGFCR
jgi:hypothetical protein